MHARFLRFACLYICMRRKTKPKKRMHGARPREFIPDALVAGCGAWPLPARRPIKIARKVIARVRCGIGNCKATHMLYALHYAAHRAYIYRGAISSSSSLGDTRKPLPLHRINIYIQELDCSFLGVQVRVKAPQFEISLAAVHTVEHILFNARYCTLSEEV